MEKDPFKEYMRESEPNEYIFIHRKLFQGIYKHAGKIRDYNITKKEWVLDGATVMYGSASELRATLEYDFSQEKDFRNEDKLEVATDNDKDEFLDLTDGLTDFAEKDIIDRYKNMIACFINYLQQNNLLKQ